MKTQLLLLTVCLTSSTLFACKDEERVFEDLASYTAKHYPVTSERLAQCRASQDRGCLELYEKVQRAKERLFAGGRTNALRLTGEAVLEHCPPEKWKAKPGYVGTDESRCRGAAVALWYLSEPESDEHLLRVLEGRGAALRGLMESSGGTPWLPKRPDADSWIDLFLRTPGAMPEHLSAEALRRVVEYAEEATASDPQSIEAPTHDGLPQPSESSRRGRE